MTDGIRRAVAVLSVLVVLGALPERVLGQSGGRPRVRIAIVLDGPWRRSLSIQEAVRREIVELVDDEFDVRFTGPFVGDWTGAGVRRAVDRAYASGSDVVVALGVLGSHRVTHRGVPSTPTVAPLVVDPELQEIPLDEGTSGVRNLNYVIAAGDLESELAALRDVVTVRSIAFLGFEPVVEVMPALAHNVRAAAAAIGATATFVPHAATPEETLGSLPEGVDAVVVGPLFQFTPNEFSQLVAGITERKLASLALVDVQEVDQGILVGLSPRGDTSRLARRIALNVQSILLGEDAGGLPVELSNRQQLTINMATARALGVSPRWEVLTHAVLLHAEEPPVRTLSLPEAATEAIDANLDLQVADRAVAAGRESVKRERAGLLPQIGGSLRGTFIDDDRAEASFGATRERTLTGAVGLSQSIYSDSLWARYQIERYDQRGREYERESVRLDIARDAAVAYLDVLRTLALERIERDNLSLTRENLELAQVRVSVGVSNRSDEYRWESEIASDRRAVIDATAVRRQSEYDLNRILNRPIEERFGTMETGIDDPRLLGTTSAEYVDRPATFVVFRDFMVEHGLARSPELRALDAAIAAQDRVLTNAKRSFWLPDFSVGAEYADRLEQDGAGRPQDVPGLDVPRQDDQDWTVQLEATLPLFTSGRRLAEMRGAQEDLQRLRTLYRSTSQKVEQEIRSSLLQSQSSFASIRLTREAAEAAGKNLDLVSDSYSRGAVDIITLLDAQNAALVADQAAATAVFTFLTDWTRAQRAVSDLIFLMDADERVALQEEVDAFFVAAGVPAGRR